jgi:hypothetical protein
MWQAPESSGVKEQVGSRSALSENPIHNLETSSEPVQELRQELARLKSVEHSQANALSQMLVQNASISSEREALARQLDETKSSMASLQEVLESMGREKQDNALLTSELQARIDKLNKRTAETPETVAQGELPVSDRDIRELMGARNLYITDVVDVDKNGHTRRPFGRIFYTQGKSLIFYAFDLDQQRGLHNAAFQLWGQRGSNRGAYVNMGVFYLDSGDTRRWVLKFDNPEKLAQINAVFVTVEPSGGSRKPAGKQLLYASLRTLPNHP